MPFFHLNFALATAEELACIRNTEDIALKLGCLHEISFTENRTATLNTREFEIKFNQPMDHENLNSKTFSQRIILLHRNVTEPLVLYTTGYWIFRSGQSAITSAFQTNQLLVEHRYFAGSIPENADWKFLNVQQSADDFHAITLLFKQIYPGPWVNTGTSKGGMTSVYHHYFYPGDLAGTVANSAPLSFSDDDQRYPDFLNRVGGPTYDECRQKLKDVQLAILKNRDAILPLMVGNFTRLGSSDVSLEHAVIDLSFGFWQTRSADSTDGCAAIPSADSPVATLFQFLDEMGLADDSKIQQFMPYYFQSANQLGAPGNQTAHLEQYRRYSYTSRMYVENELAISYTNELMRKIDLWSRQDADQMMHIYGEFDPWSAGAFPASETGKNVFKAYVPHANHNVNFSQLPEPLKAQAIQTLSHWLGKSPSNVWPSAVTSPSLESIDANFFRP